MESDGANVSYLVCRGCGVPYCRAADVIAAPAAVLTSHVYAYELDVLGVEGTAYSATNPTDARFDVVRLAPRVAVVRATASDNAAGDTDDDYTDAGGGAGVPGPCLRCDERFSPEHSWFTGFEWAMLSCAGCGAHRGWGFRPTTAAAAAAPPVADRGAIHASPTVPAVNAPVVNDSGGLAAGLAFVGLIVTQTREAEIAPADAKDRADAIQWDSAAALRGAAARAVALLRRLPVAALAAALAARALRGLRAAVDAADAAAVATDPQPRATRRRAATVGVPAVASVAADLAEALRVELWGAALAAEASAVTTEGDPVAVLAALARPALDEDDEASSDDETESEDDDAEEEAEAEPVDAGQVPAQQQPPEEEGAQHPQ